MRFAGYAALFGKRDAGRDVIRKGAFVRTLAERRDPIPLFWQHRPEMRIGWVERIAEDAKGLRVIASIDNPDGGAAAALKQGTTNGLSFGYRARGYLRDAAGRELTDIDLYEVSLVSHPMQHAARVHLVEGADELKFNLRHYRENGQFARAGEGVLHGRGTARSGLAPRSPEPTPARANSRTAISNGTTDETSLPQRDIVVIGERDRQLRDDFDATFSAEGEAGRSAQTTRKQPSAAPQRPSTSRELGSLSAHYETGGRGVSTVSSGMGRNGVPDRGGVSYGSYQMTSQTPQRDNNGNFVIVRDGGNVARFFQTDGARWANDFVGHQPGSSGFSAAWRRVAQREGAALHEAEHAWVKRKIYDPAASLIKNETRLDVDAGPPALRDALWSSAVQHGAGSPKRLRLGARRIFIDAINRTDTTIARTDPRYHETLIRNVYARRTTFWPSDRPRYESELQAALRRLKAP